MQKRNLTIRRLYGEGKVSIWYNKIKGFCVFSDQPLKEGELITQGPVALIGFNDLKESSPLNIYPMYWNSKTDCISFGVINLLNHSDHSNIRLTRDYQRRMIRAYALYDIDAHTELTIDYGCPLWFNPV